MLTNQLNNLNAKILFLIKLTNMLPIYQVDRYDVCGGNIMDGLREFDLVEAFPYLIKRNYKSVAYFVMDVNHCAEEEIIENIDFMDNTNYYYVYDYDDNSNQYIYLTVIQEGNELTNWTIKMIQQNKLKNGESFMTIHEKDLTNK